MLEQLQRAQHHRNAALHVSEAGAVQHPVFHFCYLLEGVVRREYRIHMAGQQDAHRCFRANRHHQMLAALDLIHRAIGAHRLDRGRVDQPGLTGQDGKRVSQQGGDGLQPIKIGRATVDLCPRNGPGQRGQGDRLFERRLFG